MLAFAAARNTQQIADTLDATLTPAQRAAREGAQQQRARAQGKGCLVLLLLVALLGAGSAAASALFGLDEPDVAATPPEAAPTEPVDPRVDCTAQRLVFFDWEARCATEDYFRQSTGMTPQEAEGARTKQAEEYVTN